MNKIDRLSRQPLFRMIFPPVMIILASVVLGVLLVVLLKSPPEKQNIQTQALLIETIEVQPQVIQHVISSQGIVQPQTKTVLISEVKGRVVEISPAFVAGSFVNKDQVLIKLEDSDYQAQVKSAQANLAHAQANLSEELARSQQAQEDWQRLGKGKANDLVLRKPQLAREQANLLSADAALATAEQQLRRSSIRAPYNGLVTERAINLGQYIGQGKHLGSMAATNIAELRMPLLESDLQFLELSGLDDVKTPESLQHIVQLYNNNETQPWLARLVRSEAVVDEKTRFVYVVAVISDPYILQDETEHPSVLKFGSYVSAKIIGKQGSDLFAVPRSSLRADARVVVIDETKRVRLRSVEVVRKDDKYAYIRSGLEAGEVIAVTPIQTAIEGMLVEISQTSKKNTAQMEDVNN